MDVGDVAIFWWYSPVSLLFALAFLWIVATILSTRGYFPPGISSIFYRRRLAVVRVIRQKYTLELSENRFSLFFSYLAAVIEFFVFCSFFLTRGVTDFSESTILSILRGVGFQVGSELFVYKLWIIFFFVLLLISVNLFKLCVEESNLREKIYYGVNTMVLETLFLPILNSCVESLVCVKSGSDYYQFLDHSVSCKSWEGTAYMVLGIIIFFIVSVMGMKRSLSYPYGGTKVLQRWGSLEWMYSFVRCIFPICYGAVLMNTADVLSVDKGILVLFLGGSLFVLFIITCIGQPFISSPKRADIRSGSLFGSFVFFVVVTFSSLSNDLMVPLICAAIGFFCAFFFSLLLRSRFSISTKPLARYLSPKSGKSDSSSRRAHAFVLLGVMDYLVRDPEWFEVDSLMDADDKIASQLLRDLECRSPDILRSSVLISAVVAAKSRHRDTMENVGFRHLLLNRCVEDPNQSMAYLYVDCWIVFSLTWGSLPDFEGIFKYLNDNDITKRLIGAMVSQRLVKNALCSESVLMSSLMPDEKVNFVWKLSDLFTGGLIPSYVNGIKMSRDVIHTSTPGDGSSALSFNRDISRGGMSFRVRTVCLDALVVLLSESKTTKGACNEFVQCDGISIVSAAALEESDPFCLRKSLKCVCTALEFCEHENLEFTVHLDEFTTILPVERMLQIEQDFPNVLSVPGDVVDVFVWYGKHARSASALVMNLVRILLQQEGVWVAGHLQSLFYEIGRHRKSLEVMCPRIRAAAGCCLGTLYKAFCEAHVEECNNFPKFQFIPEDKGSLAQLSYMYYGSYGIHNYLSFLRNCGHHILAALLHKYHWLNVGEPEFVRDFLCSVLKDTALKSVETKRAFEEFKLIPQLIEGLTKSKKKKRLFLDVMDSVVSLEGSPYERGFMNRQDMGSVHSSVGSLILRDHAETLIHLFDGRVADPDTSDIAVRVFMRIVQNPHMRTTTIHYLCNRSRGVLETMGKVLMRKVSMSEMERKYDKDLFLFCGNCAMACSAIAVDDRGARYFVDSGGLKWLHSLVQLYVLMIRGVEDGTTVFIGDGKEITETAVEMARVVLYTMKSLSHMDIEYGERLQKSRAPYARGASHVVYCLNDDNLYHDAANLISVWLSLSGGRSPVIADLISTSSWSGIFGEAQDPNFRFMHRVKWSDNDNAVLLPPIMRLRECMGGDKYVAFMMARCIMSVVKERIVMYEKRRKCGWDKNLPLCGREEVFWSLALFAVVDLLPTSSGEDAEASRNVMRDIADTMRGADGVARLMLALCLFHSERFGSVESSSFDSRMISAMWTLFAKELTRDAASFVGYYVEEQVAEDCMTFVALTSQFPEWVEGAAQTDNVMKLLWNNLVNDVSSAEAVLKMFVAMSEHSRISPISILYPRDEETAADDNLDSLCQLVNPDSQNSSPRLCRAVYDLLSRLSRNSTLRAKLASPAMARIMESLLAYVSRSVSSYFFLNSKDIQLVELSCLKFICEFFKSGKLKHERFARFLSQEGVLDHLVKLSDSRYRMHENYKSRMLSILSIVSHPVVVPHAVLNCNIVDTLKHLVDESAPSVPLAEAERWRVRAGDFKFLAACILSKIIDNDTGKTEVVKSGVWQDMMDSLKEGPTGALSRLKVASTVVHAATKWKKKLVHKEAEDEESEEAEVEPETKAEDIVEEFGTRTALGSVFKVVPLVKKWQSGIAARKQQDGELNNDPNSIPNPMIRGDSTRKVAALRWQTAVRKARVMPAFSSVAPEPPV